MAKANYPTFERSTSYEGGLSFFAPLDGRDSAIVSVESVSADPNSELEQLIAKNYGDACAIEMEGYGAAFASNKENTPCILVRGISDKRGGKRTRSDKVRQPVAACHASAFAFELLSAWNRYYPSSSNRSLAIERAEPSHQQPESPAVPPLDSEGSLPQRDVGWRVVINLAGTKADYPATKINEFVQDIREIADDKEITLVRTEYGSVRIILSDPRHSLRKFAFNELHGILSAKCGAVLLGVVDENEFNSLKEIERELERASQDLMAWRTTLPSGERIVRPELSLLIDSINDRSPNPKVVIGAPGSGKSALLATLSETLRAEHCPILAIKADLLDPSISDEEGLQKFLGLSGRPSTLIERLSKFGPVALLIDQLDALAGYLDVRTGRLSVLLNLVRRLGRNENVHIVMSARAFEYEHDVRLSAIAAESVTLQLPPWSAVLNILQSKGIDASGWPEDAQEVMRSPQALATYLSLTTDAKAPAFTTYQAMLDQLWKDRILIGDSGARRSQLASTIAGLMAEEESLWLAGARFDESFSDVQALTSAGVLTSYGAMGSIGFTHQTIFDYTLARSFAQSKGRLSQFVQERQISIFVRPKVWAALNYLRAVELHSYEREFEAIWTAPELRRHLKLLLIDFIGQQSDPSDFEQRFMAEALQVEPDRAVAFRAIMGSRGWFVRLAKTQVSAAMRNGGAEADLVLQVLVSAIQQEPELVITLLKENWAGDTQNDQRVWIVLERAHKWTDAMLELAIPIVRRARLSLFAINNEIAELGVEQPEMAIALLRSRLEKDLADACAVADTALANRQPEPSGIVEIIAYRMRSSPAREIKKLIESDNDWDSVPALAEANPVSFIKVMWPWLVTVFDALGRYDVSRKSPDTYDFPYEGDFRFEEEDGSSLPEPHLLAAFRVAVEHLATEHLKEYVDWTNEAVQYPFMLVQRLIAHTFAQTPEQFEQVAFQYLMGDLRRLHLGGLGDVLGTTTRLIKAVSPYWSQGQVEEFEKLVDNYSLPNDSSADADTRRRRAQLARRFKMQWFRAIPVEKLSDDSRRHLLEEERVFPNEPIGIKVGEAREVGPIMDAEDIARASDEAVLNAFEELPDSTGWENPKSFGLGGNIPLSRAFVTFAREHPGRAIHLISRFRPGVGERAAGSALDIFAEVLTANEFTNVFLELVDRDFGNEEFRGASSYALSRLTNRNIPLDERVIAVLVGWLESPINRSREDTKDRADADKHDAPSDGKQAPEQSSKSMLWENGGVDFLPGGDYPVLDTLMRALLFQGRSDELARILLTYLRHSSDPEVWSASLHLLQYLNAGDIEIAKELIAEIFAKFPGLSTTREGGRLLAHIHWWAPEFVRAELSRWRQLDQHHVHYGYGELISLIALLQPNLGWAEEALGEIISDLSFGEARVGAALTAANLWPDLARRPAATSLLVPLLQRLESGVWDATFEIFRLVDELAADSETATILEVLAANIGRLRDPVPTLNSTFVVERLQSLLPNFAPLVGDVALNLALHWHRLLTDLRTSTASAAPELVDLAITLHRLGADTREIGTRLFELMVELDAYTARQTLSEIDSRFRHEAHPTRRRLPRRPRQSRGRTTRRRINK